MRIDEFFEKQPTPRFQELLNAPRHTKPPKIFGKRQAEQGEVSVQGAYLAECCEDFREAILTATDDFSAFLGSVGAGGDSYPIRIERADGFSRRATASLSVRTDAPYIPPTPRARDVPSTISRRR
jgi:hypothetical protein